MLKVSHLTGSDLSGKFPKAGRTLEQAAGGRAEARAGAKGL